MSASNNEGPLQGENSPERITPKLVQRGDDDEIQRQLQPDTVTRFGGTLPFDTESEQLQCGKTVSDATGDQNIRLNMEMVITHSQFKTLASMRANPNSLEIISAGYSGPATFDQLKFDRLPDANGAVYADGSKSEEPRYTVQLQSKEQTDEGEGIFVDSASGS